MRNEPKTPILRRALDGISPVLHTRSRAGRRRGPPRARHVGWCPAPPGRGGAVPRTRSDAHAPRTHQAAGGGPGLHRGIHRGAGLLAQLWRNLHRPRPLAPLQGRGPCPRPSTCRSWCAGAGQGQGQFHRTDGEDHMILYVRDHACPLSRPLRTAPAALPPSPRYLRSPSRLRSFLPSRAAGHADFRMECRSGAAIG